jgi:hypothetical protein
MQPQRQNNHNNPQMELAMQRMVEVHTEMMQVMTQYMVNCDSKELPPGMQQVLDNHSQMVQMMPHILSSTNDNLSQNNLGSKEPRGEAEITLLACKSYGEIGHTYKGCCEQCPYCDTSHSAGECPMAHITCFLCDGINHIPGESKFYPMVQRMNQRAKDGLYQQQERTPKDRRPKKKKKKQDYSKILKFNCKELGHFADQCPERNNKSSTPGSVKKDLSTITCYKCKQKGHYADKCPEKST